VKENSVFIERFEQRQQAVVRHTTPVTRAFGMRRASRLLACAFSIAATIACIDAVAIGMHAAATKQLPTIELAPVEIVGQKVEAMNDGDQDFITIKPIPDAYLLHLNQQG